MVSMQMWHLAIKCLRNSVCMCAYVCVLFAQKRTMASGYKKAHSAHGPECDTGKAPPQPQVLGAGVDH